MDIPRRNKLLERSTAVPPPSRPLNDRKTALEGRLAEINKGPTSLTKYSFKQIIIIINKLINYYVKNLLQHLRAVMLRMLLLGCNTYTNICMATFENATMATKIATHYVLTILSTIRISTEFFCMLMIYANLCKLGHVTKK